MSLPLSVSALLDRLAARLFPAHENQQGRRGRHGILPPLLVVLTFVTGLVDAVSYLGLDRVFVANMTGNVVFVGFALAGDTRLSAAASLLAVSAFFAGALAGGRFAAPRIKDPMVMFAALVGGHAVLVAAALGAGLGGAAAYPVIALLAVGMGLQNAVVQRLAVPDLTTTVLTRTLTGLAADPSGPAALRRAVSIAAMFCGALAGGLLQLRHGAAAALAPAFVLLAAVALAAAAGPALNRDPGSGSESESGPGPGAASGPG